MLLKVFEGFIKRYVMTVALLGIGWMMLRYAEQASEAVRNGIALCVCSVIPSLFPMMFLSQYLIKSGAAAELGSLFGKPLEKLFGLPGVCGAAALTGLVGGYPTGARAAEALVESGSITPKQGRRLAEFMFCSGPGFTVGMIGAQLYKNKTAGLLILTAQMVSCIILGIVLKLSEGNLTDGYSLRSCSSSVSMDRGQAFVESAVDTAEAVLAMCSFILVFQVLSAMLRVAGVFSLMTALWETVGLQALGECLLPCALEVTGGSILSVKLGLPFTAFAVGFGGLSVHFQNFALCRRLRLNRWKYIGLRLLQGLLCSVLVSLALKTPFFSERTQSAAVMIGADDTIAFSRVSYSFGVLMLLMCLMSVVCLPHGKEVKA